MHGCLHNLDRLIAFMNVVEAGSVTRAAEHLFLTEPGISRHIKVLESELRVKLLDRRQNGMAPTEAGRLLYDYAKKLTKLLDELEATFAELRAAQVGSLTIGAVMALGKYLLPPILSGFKGNNPGAEISLRIAYNDVICQLVRNGEIQLGLTTEIQTPDDLRVEVLCRDELVLVAAPEHPLSRLETVTPEQLAHIDFVLPPASTSGRLSMLVNDSLARLGIVRRSIMRLDFEAMKAAVQANPVVGILQRLSVVGELEAGTLREIKVGGLDMWGNYNIVSHPSAYQSPILRLFLAYLREEAPCVVLAAQSAGRGAALQLRQA